MAASKFSLNSWPAGGFQFCRELGRINRTASELWASRNSLSKSVTLWFNCPGCCILPPWTTVFLLCQMSQLWTRKISSSSIDNLAIITWNSYIKSSNFPPFFCIRATDPAQTSWAAPQSQRAWIIVSEHLWQISHLSSCSTCCRTRFTFDGKMLRQARQPKTFILLGTWSCHSCFQILWSCLYSELSSLPFDGWKLQNTFQHV